MSLGKTLVPMMYDITMNVHNFSFIFLLCFLSFYFFCTFLDFYDVEHDLNMQAVVDEWASSLFRVYVDLFMLY